MRLTLEIFQEPETPNQWTSRCVELDVVSAAVAPEIAIETVAEAARMVLQGEMARTGTTCAQAFDAIASAVRRREIDYPPAEEPRDAQAIAIGEPPELLETALRRKWENESIERIAKLGGITVDELKERWVTEKLSDDLRRRLLRAAGADTPNPMIVFDETCAITMYDMHVQLSSDGRARGLWVFLKDDSPDRERNLGELKEGALLEWPAARAFHAAMGEALRHPANLAEEPREAREVGLGTPAVLHEIATTALALDAAMQAYEQWDGNHERFDQLRDAALSARAVHRAALARIRS